MSSDLLVLCYHAVSERWPADLSITPENLEAQLDLLADRGYRGVTFTDAVKGAPEGKAVAVTFDDAYRSVLELGGADPGAPRAGPRRCSCRPTSPAPSARCRGRESTTGRAASSTVSWCRCPGRSWTASPHEAGRSAPTPARTRISPGCEDAVLEDELRRSKSVCEERLGRACESIAYPYGDHDARVVEVARRAGYRTAGTLPSRMDAGDPLRWPRVGVYYGDDLRRFKAKVSPLVRGLRASRAWEAADRLRTRLRGG